MTKEIKKIYCYVDETGQDPGEVFVVVAVIVASNVEAIRERLHDLEKSVKIGVTKWHKSSYKYRIAFLEGFLRQDNSDLHIYFIKAQKPVLYYAPTLEVIQQALSAHSKPSTQAIICIDGLDELSAKKFTNSLRTKNLKVKLAKGLRDESESLIRLADRWAGCIRMALSGNKDCEALVNRAKKKNVLKEI